MCKYSADENTEDCLLIKANKCARPIKIKIFLNESIIRNTEYANWVT